MSGDVLIWSTRSDPTCMAEVSTIAPYEFRAFPESAFLDEPGMVAQVRAEIVGQVEELALIHSLNQVTVGIVLLFFQMGQHPSRNLRPSRDGAEVVDLG